MSKAHTVESSLSTHYEPIVNRAYNFSAGPAVLPEPVLQRAHQEFLDYQGLGMSLMEMSHRSDEFIAVAEQAEQDLRKLLAVPADYEVLFVHGGGRGQFSMVPLNLLRGKSTADYVNTGIWSEYATEEARRYCHVNLAADGKATHYTTIPDLKEWHLSSDAAYLHYVDNETVHGVEFTEPPNTGDVPLVSDMSSNILSRPIDVSRFGLIYAGAQKNIGPAGLAIVIVRKDLLGQALPFTPSMYDYQHHALNQSMYNTPPTYPWYIAGLVFQWVLAEGGVAAMAERNARKAQKLYDCIDNSGFYENPVDRRYRSRMNVVFRLRDETLTKSFLTQAEAQGLSGLKGHRIVGGMRASIYNAMPEKGVDALVQFMTEFERRNG